MKVRIRYRSRDLNVDETVAGASAEDLVREVQRGVAAHVGFPVRLVVNAMRPLQFAQEVVKRYNATAGKSLPMPATCEEFLRLGEGEGIVTVLER